ncbi:MAG: tetraacyldisaccharide 4'-kinase [Planctomycetota bacterium]|nr:tetraacyldisaccharide 4'-kinase [Planctomycetota bacterium]MDA1211872.1 tetraacyldisaccharide 4'-kinase [Planctomycetota bacterium]
MKPDFYHSLISERSRKLVPSCLRGVLSLASIGYSIGSRLRNAAYDHGWKGIQHADTPVVSVGNLTAGGTGKTPVVGFLAERFRERNFRVAILSRGYRALKSTGNNDEKLLLDRLCPGVPHLQNADRVELAKRAVREFSAQVLILDDGFQHRRLARDLDIVLIDCLNPWGYGKLLPRGLLREPMSSLRRADLIMLTRADLCPPEQRISIRDKLEQFRGTAECVEIAFRPAHLVGRNAETASIESLRGAPILAACGIGNPQGFSQTLERLGCRIVGFERFADHHHYSLDDCRHLSHEALRLNVTAILMTEKDLVKIPSDFEFPVAFCAIRLGTVISSGQELLDKKLNEIAIRDE